MRATFLHYRNPKEATPSAYYPQSTTYGHTLYKFESMRESESKQGSFAKNERFEVGSIYKNLADRTANEVGPGAYKEEQVVHLLKKKPCMSTFQPAQIAPSEGHFEIHGH